MPVQNPFLIPIIKTRSWPFRSTLDELVAKGHPFCMINDIINRINIQRLLNAYNPCSINVYAC
jgi:hypothetical protein